MRPGLWTGGLATAVVAALVAVVGVLVARGLFDVPVLAPTGEGALGNANTARLAALAALLATGLMHLLLLSCVGFRWYEWRAMRPRKGEVCGVGLVRQC